MYPNHALLQRPIVASNNPVKQDVDCSKENEKRKEQDSKYLQPRWYPSGLSHTQKRRLQRMRKESMEQQVEVVPKTSAIMKKVWWPKQNKYSPQQWSTSIWTFGRFAETCQSYSSFRHLPFGESKCPHVTRSKQTFYTCKVKVACAWRRSVSDVLRARLVTKNFHPKFFTSPLNTYMW